MWYYDQLNLGMNILDSQKPQVAH